MQSQTTGPLVDPTTGLSYYPCEQHGCWFAMDAEGTLYYAPMFVSGEADMANSGPIETFEDVPEAEIRAFLAKAGS